jgi:hypothetical protein
MTGGIDLPASGMLLGSGVSAVAHLTIFGLLGLVLTAATGLSALTRSPGRTEYWLLFVLSSVVMTATLLRVVLAQISIVGGAAWLVSVAMGLAVAAAWSGIGRQRRAGRAGTASALDVWLAPVVTGRIRTVSAVGLLAVPIAAHLVVARVATFDWEFMLQKLGALCAWLAAFAFVHAMVRERNPSRMQWIAPVVLLGLFSAEQLALPSVPSWTHDARLNPELVLDGYAAVDPSFRIARDFLRPSAGEGAAPFYAYLRANSTLQNVPIAPVAVDFVPAAAHAVDSPPNIFLFIIDSLRPDYLSPYNSAVSFTPSVREFANDSFVFSRVFSRYGGTGLSVPSIWAGAMLIHKQYVTPFASTNALEKLVNANGYRRLVTEDHISDALFSANPENPGNLENRGNLENPGKSIGLDHNVPEMLHTFCRTMGELTENLRKTPKDGRPIFAMTRPLELHIGNIATATVPAGESYPGFYGPYAARVKRIDACFGEFIGALKELHLYDNSIVVLTADHGDSLGEGQRWGHGFTVFPEVMRIPLVIHVPPALRPRVTADLARVSFSIDITPTLYALAGEMPSPPRERDELKGEPLLVPPSVDLARRRRGEYLVASSYGAVYGLLSHNGRRLYIADGIEGREYAFDLSPGAGDRRIGVTDAERDAARLTIRRQIGDLADWYHFTPAP